MTAHSVDQATRAAVSAEINGLPAEAHLERHVSEVLPELAPAVTPILERVRESGRPEFGGELTGETPAQPGTERIWLINCIPLPRDEGRASIAVVFSEATALRRAEQRLRTVMDSLFTFVGLLDPDGTLLEANRAALEVSGLAPEEVIGRPFTEAYWWSHDAAARRRLGEAIERANDGKPSRFDVEARIGEDAFLTIDFQLVPLVEGGVVTALIPSAIDITQRIAVTRQTAALAELASQVNKATTPDAVARASAAGTAATGGASFASVALADHEARTLRLWHQPGTPASLAEGWEELPLVGTTPMHDAIRADETVLVTDPDERRRRSPRLAAAADALQLGATAAVPLRRSDGTVLGALGVGWPVDEPPDQRALDQIRTVADLVAQGIERTQLADLRHRLVVELHDQLLRPPPAIDGLDVAVRYRPAATGLGFGGDWYDVVPLGPDATALVIGDVVGHGVEAAAQMAILQNLLRTLLRQGIDLDVLPFRIDELIDEEARGFTATAAVAVIDAGRRALRYVRLGHPPPLLRRADGTVVLLDGGHQPGIGLAPQGAAVGTAELDPGSTLVLFTDGLVERPRRDLLESIAAAGDRLAAMPPGDAASIADELAHLVDDEPDQRDDAVIVVVTVRS